MKQPLDHSLLSSGALEVVELLLNEGALSATAVTAALGEHDRRGLPYRGHLSGLVLGGYAVGEKGAVFEQQTFSLTDPEAASRDLRRLSRREAGAGPRARTSALAENERTKAVE